MSSREWACQGEIKVDLFMHSSISAITLSLYCHLVSFFIYLFIYFLSGCFLSTSCHSSPFPLLVHGYFYPFYIFSNLWDCSLLSLRLYQPLLASFQDCLLACWLLGHYLCSEGAYHTIPHFIKKVFVFYFSLAHYLVSPQWIRIEGSLYLPLWGASSGPSLCLPLLGEIPSSKAFFERSLDKNPRIDPFSPHRQTTLLESLDRGPTSHVLAGYT